ncbi:MAG: peptide-methionine (S)-S-oxide reductase, partial [Burkholderiaceae bacterium]
MTSTPSESPGIQTAIFGGGCFWCLEAVFQRTTGVTRVLSG